MTKDQAEAANWRIAHEWAADLDLTYAGVALDDCAVYPMLSTVGRLLLQALAQTEGAQHDDAR
jgi:hypothetical protein